MTWEKGTGPCGPNCSPHDVNKTGTVPAPLQSLTWNCTSGCGASKKIYADVNYIVTSVSYNSSGWEQGEFFFITRDLKGTGPFEVSIEGIKWMVSPDKVNGGGRMVTTLDLGVRNDSRNPNASPIAGVQPSVGIQFGCTSEVPFAIVDPDADTIRCRLATDQECGDSCTNLPNFHLDKEKCSLTITATASNGFVPEHDYRLTVMLEDYPDYTISMGKEIRSIRRPMSKIPLQLTIRTITDMKPCNSKRGHFENVYPNFNDYHRVPYPGPFVGVFKSRIFMQAQDINNTEIMLSIPANMRSDLLPDDRNHTGIPVRSDVVQEYFRMIPNRRQIADTILYVDNCPPSNPCQHNGTCMDLYRRYTCKCPHGYKPLDCSHKFQRTSYSFGRYNWCRNSCHDDCMLLLVVLTRWKKTEVKGTKGQTKETTRKWTRYSITVENVPFTLK
ncbi:hypothetical protein FSP39_017418 [Pinctada imbricata]|uniref:EGF-like domain-containing protein n=1 Tax=Pinctada imbricata TaxID=66713 RepID=A0AA88Y9C0_PINIB|nr:hypothetical protein FSP39_017418 [Pinctada imbricata]